MTQPRPVLKLIANRQSAESWNGRRRLLIALRLTFRIVGMGRQRALGPLSSAAAPALFTGLGIAFCCTQTNAAPVEYVRVCDFTGAGFFYVPGTDKCAYGNNLPYQYQSAYGTYSTQPGTAAAAYGTNSFANGNNSVAIGDHSFAGGDPASASPGQSASGIDANIPNSAFSNVNTTAIGQGSRAGATADGQSNATAVGQGALANSLNATAIGQGSSATGNSASALGRGASASGDFSVAVGGGNATPAIASGTGAVAIGNNAISSALVSVALGTNATANVDKAVALGGDAKATAAGAVALGQGAIANQANTVSVGAVGTERRIVNVAPGTVNGTSTDAVNGSQLFSVQSAAGANTANLTTLGTTTANTLGGGATYNAATGITGFSYTLNGSATPYTTVVSGIQALANGGAGPVQYATPGTPSNSLKLVGTGGAVALGNVANGVAGTDAVNVNQLNTVTRQGTTNAANLNALGTSTASAIGGGATYNSATGITGPSYNLNGSTATYTNAVAGIQALANGAAGPVQYSTPGTPSNSVNLVGTGGPVTLGNVAAGAVTATSTDAVNGSQLFTTNQALTALQNGSSGLVQQNATTRAITVGATTNGTVVNVSGTQGARTVTGVAAGALGTGSTDAVNGSQLFATNTQVGSNTVAIGTLQNGQSGPFRDNNTSGFAAPQATGADAVAGGFGSVASAAQATALGTNAQANQVGATAIGYGAVASGDPTLAAGMMAVASGNNSVALGANATASSTNAIAVGQGATASQANAIALGQGATAAQANSVAIGQGVTTTRAGQVAVGTGGNTYTLAGVTSAASLAAQGTPVGFVTADGAGNLAVNNNVATATSVAALDGRVGSLEAGLANLTQYAIQSRQEARRGIAAAAATATAAMPSAPGKVTYAVNSAIYRGQAGFSGALAYRLNTAVPMMVTGAYSNGGGREHIVKIGMGGEF